MGDIALKGAELKKTLAIAKKRDLNFAYCPGNDPKEDVFVLDRKKKPEVIGRVARAEGTGTKLGYGTASVKGKVIRLTCEKELPQMAKKLKKLLKFEKTPLNVIVLDQSGNVLEEDIEDLGEDEEDDAGVGEDAAVDEAADGEAQEAEAEEVESNEAESDEVDANRLKDLTARAGDVKQAIGNVENPDMQAKLAKGFAGAIAALKDQKLDTADGVLTKLEAALDKLPPTGNPAASNDADPALAKLRQVAERQRKQIDDLGNIDAVAKLNAVHGMLETQIGEGDVKKAAGTAKALGDAIAKSAAQTAPAPETNENDNAEADSGNDDLATTWADTRADLEPVIMNLLHENYGDVSKMRGALGIFIERGEGGDFAGAMKVAPLLKKLIAEAEAAEMTAAEADIPAGVVPFVRARLDWIKTRTSLKAELTKLQTAIIGAVDPEEYPDMANESKELFTYLEKLDGRLEAALEALVQEPDGDKRETLKNDARRLLTEFQSELDTPFFQAVDGGNGFKPVNVRGAAMASLGKVNEALSTAAAA